MTLSFHMKRKLDPS